MEDETTNMGAHLYYLDAKGRLVVPAEFRGLRGGKELDRFVLTQGFENCIAAFTPEAWGVVEAKLRALRMTDPNDRALQRFFMSSATACDLDRQGRLTIPQALREHAGIRRDVMITGLGSRLEIWARERWQTVAAEAERNVQSSAKSFDL